MKRTKRDWADLATLCGMNMHLIVASLFEDHAMPTPWTPFERYGLSIPSSEAERRELDRAAETILAGKPVLAFAPKIRWGLLWRLSAAQHLFRWYAKNPHRKSDALLRFLNTLNNRALFHCLLLDSACFPFALLGAACDHLLEDICCTPGLLRQLPGGKEVFPLFRLD